ncbi:hypothetical protein ACRFCX_24565 [Klebsiella pneumoniae]
MNKKTKYYAYCLARVNEPEIFEVNTNETDDEILRMFKQARLGQDMEHSSGDYHLHRKRDKFKEMWEEKSSSLSLYAVFKCERDVTEKDIIDTSDDALLPDELEYLIEFRKNDAL